MASEAKYYDVLGMYGLSASDIYEECVSNQGLAGAELTEKKTKNNWSGYPADTFSDDGRFTNHVIVYCEHDGEKVTYYKLQVLLKASLPGAGRAEELKILCERCGIDLEQLTQGVVCDETLNQGIVNGTEYSGTIDGVPVKVSVIGYDALAIVGKKSSTYTAS